MLHFVCAIVFSLCTSVHGSILRDSLSCPPGYGPSMDGLRCVYKVILPTRKTCSPPLIRHGHYELQLGGRMAKFWCDDGRSLVPSNASYAMCSAFGQWDREHPKCVLTETGGCGELPEEDHLTAFKLHEIKEGITTYGFECDPGFDLIGPLVISCNGYLWNGTVPGCQEKAIEPISVQIKEESFPSPESEPPLSQEPEHEEVETEKISRLSDSKATLKPRRLSEYTISMSPKVSACMHLIILSSLFFKTF